jgi:hypothetical protein
MLRRSALAAVLVTLLVSACGGDDDMASEPTTTTTTTVAEVTTTAPTTTTTIPVPSCDPATVDPDELEPTVEVAVPLGFEQQPDDFGDTGPSSFDKAVRDDGEPGALEALQAAQFMRGYQRLWVNAAGVQLIAFVYEFCDPAGAQAYGDRSEQAFGRLGQPRFIVDGVDGAIGFSGTGQRTAAQVLVEHDRFVLMAVSGGDPDDIEVDDVEQLTTDLVAGMLEALPEE